MAARALPKKAEKKLAKAQRAVESAKFLFNQYYKSLYGERWPSLMAALEKPIPHCAMWNLFATAKDDLTANSVKSALFAKGAISLHLARSLECLFLPQAQDGHNFPPPQKSIETGLSCYYPMDASSILPVRSLDIQEGESVLDMCAAPGGKSLAIAMQLGLWPRAFGRLHANDVSNDRRRRLRQVLESYLPAASIEECVRVTGFDSTVFRSDGELFDKSLFFILSDNLLMQNAMFISPLQPLFVF